MTADSNKKTLTRAHAVILLAAGLSQRLGTPKQLLLREGLPLITHMLTVAKLTQPAKIIVVVPDGLPTVTVAVRATDIPDAQLFIVQNQHSQLGMAHSLQLGIEALRAHAADCTRVLIMGVDQIHLDTAHLQGLLAASQPIAVSSYPAGKTDDTDDLKSVTGLPVVVDSAQLHTWYDKLSGDKGLRALIRCTEQPVYVLSNARLSLDIDTPEQLAHAQANGWLDK